jgi:ferric-dicitrate binding protein FerR (iron transport regulator)
MDNMKERFDVDKAWSKLYNRMEGSGDLVNNGSVAVVRRISMGSLFMRIAASLLLVIMLGSAMLIITGRFQNVKVTASLDERGKVVELPDGSHVYLNKDTRLTYPKHFGIRNREVKLDGEAFFEVTPDKSKPFRIYAGNARVKVLGTSFNVNARKKNSEVEVYVTTGIVELSETANTANRILIRPGNMGVINRSAVKITKAKNANAIAWKTGELVFSDTPLNEVIPILNDIYNAKIIAKEVEIKNVSIFGNYHGDPLDHILKAIALGAELTIVKSGDTIYLSRK